MTAVLQTVKVARESPSAVEVMRLVWDAMSTPLAIAVIATMLDMIATISSRLARIAAMT